MMQKILRRCARALVNITAWEFVKISLFGGSRTHNRARTLRKGGV